MIYIIKNNNFLVLNYQEVPWGKTKREKIIGALIVTIMMKIMVIKKEKYDNNIDKNALQKEKEIRVLIILTKEK